MKRIYWLMLMALLAPVACDEDEESVGCVGRDSCIGTIIMLESSKDYGERRIKESFAPLIGKSKKQVVLKVGAPSEIQKMDTLEVLVYFRNLGIKTKETGSLYVSRYAAIDTRQSHKYQQYDIVRCYFDNDVMVKYDFEVKR